MLVGTLCNREVIVTGTDTSIADAAKLMRDIHVGDVVVLKEGDEHHPVGLVTDRDIIVEVIAAGLDAEDVTVGDIMTETLETVTVDTDFWDALVHMRAHGVRRLPIVNEEGVLEGILTLDDLLEFVGEVIANLVALVVREIDHEKSSRTDG
jgi:CBS domain-containing protein